MNATQAQKALRALLGKTVAWRYDDKAPKADEIAELRAALPGLNARAAAAKNAARNRYTDLYTELLRDPEYLRLRAIQKDAEAARDRALSTTIKRRVTVGRVACGLFFQVVATGDNWQEAVDNARAELAKAGAQP